MRKLKMIRIILISIAFISVLIASIYMTFRKTNIEIDGNTWLKKQEESYNDLTAYFEGMDEVYTLYTIGSITESDFKNELQILNSEYKIMLSLRDKLKFDNPVRPESHSFVSFKGTKAIENMYSCTKDILDNSVDEQGNPLSADQIAYQYLAYRQTLSQYIAEYTVAMQWLNAPDIDTADTAPAK